MNTCKDCKKKIRRTNAVRCQKCYNLFRKNRAEKKREGRERNRKNNARLLKEGKRWCSMCDKIKLLSTFSTSLPSRQGLVNKICDGCLSKYRLKRAAYKKEGMKSPIFWREKAYNCNSTARDTQAKKKGLKRERIAIKDLPFITKSYHIIDLYEAQNGDCFYCKTNLPKGFHIDHKQPLSRGGKHELSNLGLCCAECNRLKHTRTAEEFFQFLLEYITRFNFLEVIESEDKEPQS